MKKSVTVHKRLSVKQKLLMLYLAVGIMGICMLIISICVPSIQPASAGSDPNENPPTGAVSNSAATSTPAAPTSTPTPTLSPTPTATSTPTPTPTPANELETDAYPEINQLIEDYYAAKLSATPEDFEPLVSDSSAIDIALIEKQYEFVRSFDNFTCYTQKGIGEVAYIVYVSYDSEIVTINTPVPALDKLTLVYSDAGTLVINMAELTDEASAYFDELWQQADVQEMYESEVKRFNDAVESDEDLAALQNRLNSDGSGN